MSYSISERCTCCDACQDECPTGAVLPTAGRYTIDPDFCDDCGRCEDVCVAAAISTS